MDEQNNDEENQTSDQEPKSENAIDKHKEKIKGLFGAFKNTVEKAVGDLTQKKSSAVSETEDATQKTSESKTPPKPSVDYKALAKEKFSQAQKIAKEMVALAQNKDIEIDFSEAENAKLISYDEYKNNIALMSEHLEAYFVAKDEGDKQVLASTRSVCRQDQTMLFSMIKDIETELLLIYRAIEQEGELETLQEDFNQITEHKWRPLVALKEKDVDSTLCSAEKFNEKFTDLLALNGAINNSIHSRLE